MLRKALFISLAAPLVACGGETTGGTPTGGSSGGGNGDLTFGQVFADIGPSVCDKLQQCDPAGYAQAFPNGQSDCLATFDRGDPNPGEVVQCTQAQADACGHDIENEPCSDLIPPAGGSAVLPSSCNGC
jgi:hypothetical protein